MPKPIQRLIVQQLIDLLEATPFSRRINAVHLHHTWRPRRVDFRGLRTIEAMRRYHIETNGWSDIAQHLTIDPTGHVWTGRDWNQPPASSSGQNGSRTEGPFMVEMIGDFDEAQEVLDGLQRAATVDVIAALFRRFKLADKDLRFHRELGSPNTCPGETIDKKTLLAEVTARLPGLPAAVAPVTPEPAGPRLFSAEHVLGYVVPGSPVAEQRADAEVPEDEAAAREIDRRTRAATAARQTRQALSLKPRSEMRGEEPQYEVLRPHVVNLSRGELSEGGLFGMKPGSLEGIVEGIRKYATAAANPHVVFYAHGGLVGERSALNYALEGKDWWLRHGVYPVFFVWESGMFEILRQFVVGPRAAPRDLADFTSDLALELLAKIPGTAVWGGMKESARRASAEDAGEGFPGGARQFVPLLIAALEKLKAGGVQVKLHAVGHSAGAIFHAHLLPVLTAAGAGIDSLSILAPAIRVDLFEEKLLPLITPDAGGAKRVRQFFMLTMEEDAEQSDNCWNVYRKSLLYFVSNSFEGVRRKPILGLQESIRKDEEMRKLFGIDEKGKPLPGATPDGTLYLSFARGNDPSELTRSLQHGCFDNDRYTMSTVLRRILGVGDTPPLGREDFPSKPTETCGFETIILPDAPDPRSRPRGSAVRTGGSGGQRLALCVGINDYPERPLAGCVADSRMWGQVLESLGFRVTYLSDQDATRNAMVAALEELVGATGPGDVAVFQYSGHGSQVADEDGDETDAFDEVFVPVDYHTGALLLDDDLAEVLGQLPSGGLLTLMMDCCHSGTNSRFAPAMRPMVTDDERVRFLPLSAEVQAAHRALAARRGYARKSAVEKSMPGVVHFAACQDNEFAWESAGQGDFTAAAAPLLRTAVSRRDSNQAFMQAVRTAVTARGRQHPLLMPTIGGLERRPLLSLGRSVEAEAGPTAPTPAASGFDDRELVEHVEAIARILRRGGGRGQ